MAKAPAFQFYVGDFLVGTSSFTAQEVGAYILLLCHQWDKGFITHDEDFLKETTRLPVKKLTKVLKKFIPVEKGIYKNERLEAERTKQDKYRETQSSNGSKGGRPPKHDKPIENPRVSEPKANESSSSSTSISSSTSSSPSGGEGKENPPPTGFVNAPVKPYMTIDDLAKKVLADSSFEEIFYRIGLHSERLQQWVFAFNRWLTYSADTIKQEKDYRTHFSNWIVKQQYSTTNGQDYQPAATQQTTTDLTPTEKALLEKYVTKH